MTKTQFSSKLPDVDLATYFIPAQEISGDFYDHFLTNDGKFLIIVADAAGEGIFACLYAFLFRSILHSLTETSLSKMIPIANHLFKKEAEKSGDFITVWIGLYDPSNHQLEYGCFGHPPAVLMDQKGKIKELGLSGGALGVMEIAPIQTTSVPFERGDLLLIYTDGVIEARNQTGEMYGKERLFQTIKAAGHSSADGLVRKLVSNLETFYGAEPLHDDVTLLALKVKAEFNC